jgi:hypothetical protein
MDKPLEPGVRKKGRNTYQVSTEYLNEDFEKMGPEKFKQLMKDKKPKTMKEGGLSAGQKKIAAKAPPPDKIDAKDFAVLKKEKAKGRGMGLQDESIKPGKVMKARYGKAIMTIAEKAMSGAKSYKNYLKGLKKATSERRSEVIKSPEYSPSNYKGTKSYKALGIKNEDEFYKIKMKDPKFAGAVYKTAGSKKIPAAVDNRIRQLNANIRMDKINQNPKAKKMYEQGVTFGKKTRKMGGGMMKARDGKAVKTDPTKTITDKGQFVKRRMKLAGSKLPGKIGTALGIASMMVPAAYAAAIQYKDYKAAKNRDEAKVKKMAGGMAKKYSKGGDLRAEYIHSQTKKNRKVTGEGYFTERSATRREEYGAAKDRYPNKMDRRKQMLKNLSRVLNPTMGVVKGTIDALNAPTTRKYSVGGGMMNKPMGYSSGTKLMDFIKSGSYTDKYGTKTNVDKAIKKINLSPKDKDLATMKPASDKKMMGGGMMNKPMGYKSGTMVKARGCKLGRTKPTKMY